MFGYVTASFKELSKQQQDRYGSVYCGICRAIRLDCSNTARIALSYDMAFLALLLMSLYEPEETAGKNVCLMHPVRRRPWVDNEYIRYAADMNVALAYYNFLDDWQDDKKLSAKLLADRFSKHMPRIREAYPAQCGAMETCISRLAALEKANCPNPDEPAGVFGELMASLMAPKDDIWAPQLRRLGFSLGRFIYLMDAAVDYDADLKKGKYNPYLAMGTGKDPLRWEEYLVLAMGRCTESFEILPLVQDKALLDNILYSGVWATYRGKGKKEDRKNDGGSL